MDKATQSAAAPTCVKDRLRVKAVLTQQGISMWQLSHEAHVSYTTVRRICSGTCHNCRLTTLEKLAKVLKVPVNTLFND